MYRNEYVVTINGEPNRLAIVRYLHDEDCRLYNLYIQRYSHHYSFWEELTRGELLAIVDAINGLLEKESLQAAAKEVN